MQSVQLFKRKTIKGHNLSITAVRLAVLHVLHAPPHSNAEQIYNIVKIKIAATSKQAIYNNMNRLVERGIIRKIKPKGRPSLYEMRVGDNHHHLVCRHCQLVVDTDCFDAAPCLEPMEGHGFVIDEAEVIFWGVCPACQRTNSNRKRREQ